MKAVIVTAADRGYLELARGWLASLLRGLEGNAEAESWHIKVLDLGLDPDQRAQLETGCDVVSPDRVYLPVDRTDEPYVRLLSRAVRPFLREYFPGYDVYVWMDADTWVQRIGDLIDFARVGHASGLALVPMLDRTYTELYRDGSELRTWMTWVYRSAFGEETLRALEHLPGLNSGVFAARHDSPLWGHYARCLEQVLLRSRRVFDQPAFNAAIYTNNVPFYPLPARYNWLCVRSLPQADLDRGLLTAPALPFEPLGIVHLTERIAHRDISVSCGDGRRRSIRLDYFGFHEAALRHRTPGPPPR